jgi:hypothetical protein
MAAAAFRGVFGVGGAGLAQGGRTS